jgi:hypothetical protein
MTIGNVVQIGNVAYIYDEKGLQIGQVVATQGGPHDGLKGSTSSTVNVRLGSVIYSYDERGLLRSQTPAI